MSSPMFPSKKNPLQSQLTYYYLDFVHYRKRRSSPSQMKPPGRKRRQVKHKLTEATMEAGEENEESDSEEESPPQADSGLPHARLNIVMYSVYGGWGVTISQDARENHYLRVLSTCRIQNYGGAVDAHAGWVRKGEVPPSA